MAEQTRPVVEEVLPKSGLVMGEKTQKFTHILCKPKLLPLKSITLEKLEEMEKEAAAAFATFHDGKRSAGRWGSERPTSAALPPTNASPPSSEA